MNTNETNILFKIVPILVNKKNDLLKIGHLNEGEQDTNVSLCQNFSDIFYLKDDQLFFTSEIKH